MAVKMLAERRNPRRVREARVRHGRWLQYKRDREWEKSIERLNQIIFRERPRGGSW